jgi:ubiquinone/menaquinone biosynthesis C-methylase UbiE
MGDGLLDVGLFLNTLFQIENKEVAVGEVARVIRKGGKLFVVDWKESFGGMGPKSQDILTPERVKTLLHASGFTFEHDFPAADHHYGLAFRKQ